MLATHYQPPTWKVLLPCLVSLWATTDTLTLPILSTPTPTYSQSLLWSMQIISSYSCTTTPTLNSYLQCAMVWDQVSGHLPTQRNQKTHCRGVLCTHKGCQHSTTSHQPSWSPNMTQRYCLGSTLKPLGISFSLVWSCNPFLLSQRRVGQNFNWWMITALVWNH